MTGFEFVSALVGHVISWPVLLLLFILLYKTPLTELLGRVKKAEGLGVTVDFGDRLAAAEQVLEGASTLPVAPGPPAEGQPAGDAKEEPADGEPKFPGVRRSYGQRLSLQEMASGQSLVGSGAYDDLGRAAESEPSYLVISAWERVVAALADLAGSRLPDVPQPQPAPSALLQQLHRAGVIDDDFLEAANDLRKLRNEVAHGRHVPTPGEAANYARLARTLAYTAQLPTPPPRDAE